MDGIRRAIGRFMAQMPLKRAHVTGTTLPVDGGHPAA